MSSFWGSSAARVSWQKFHKLINQMIKDRQQQQAEQGEEKEDEADEQQQ